MPYADLLAGLIELHVLYHAAEGEIFGLEMLSELGRHGYRVSPGTLYPLLYRLRQRGYLTVREVKLGRTRRRLYRATPKGHKALAAVRRQVRELTREIGEAAPRARPDRSRRRATVGGRRSIGDRR